MRSIYDRDYEEDVINGNEEFQAQREEYNKLVSEMINELERKTIPHKEFRLFLDELPHEGKKLLCSKLLRTISINKAMKYTNAKLMTLIFSKINTQKTEVLIIIYSLLQEIYINYYVDNNSDLLLKNESLIRERYGDWHYYFALMLVPNKIVDESILERLETLKNELNETKQILPDDKVQSDHNTTTSVQKENELLQNERRLRIALQEKNDKAEVMIKQLQVQLNTKENELKELINTNESLEYRLEQTEKQKNEINVAYQEVAAGLQRSNRELQKIQKEYSRLEMKIKPSEVEVNVSSSDLCIKEAYKLFYTAVKNEAVVRMKQVVEVNVMLEKMDSRLAIQTYFDFLTVLETFKRDNINDSSEKKVVNDEIVQTIECQENTGSTKNYDTNKNTDTILGKFTRYDHGGRIEFEDGEYINISESIVNTVGIQHDALVKCKSKEQGGYHFNLVLQGDDEASDIKQFWGYVKFNGNETASCVDIITGEEYPLHFRDISHWSINDGDTGLFNRKENNNIARISRIQKENPADYSATNIARSVKKDKNVSKKSIERFLEGCTIAIVGGLEKWFSETVSLTGAKLVHNTGEQPHRIYNDIKKSDALFLLLTANSHNATWGSVETAKESNIPIFKIQGSRSNLLSMLWDNRKVIKNANKTQNK